MLGAKKRRRRLGSESTLQFVDCSLDRKLRNQMKEVQEKETVKYTIASPSALLCTCGKHDMCFVITANKLSQNYLQTGRATMQGICSIDCLWWEKIHSGLASKRLISSYPQDPACRQTAHPRLRGRILLEPLEPTPCAVLKRSFVCKCNFGSKHSELV